MDGRELGTMYDSSERISIIGATLPKLLLKKKKKKKKNILQPQSQSNLFNSICFVP